MPLLSFIILTWNSANYLQGCFDAIIRKCSVECIPCEIIVIDNGSSDDSCDIIKRYQRNFPNTFRLINLERNYGTTYTRNLGLKQARGEFICILDSDTELGEGSLAEVLIRLRSDQRIGMIVPQLLLPNGVVQNSVKRFPTMYNKLMKLPRIVFGIRTNDSDFYGDFPFSVEREVATAISACWFFHKDLLQKVGYLDEKIFYSPEDLDYSVRIWQSGCSILYFPALSIMHHTQQLTHKKPYSKTSISHFWGLIYFYRKHGGWFIRPKYGVR